MAVEADAVAAGVLGGEERGIGPVHEIVEPVGVLRARDAEAGGEGGGVAASGLVVERLADPLHGLDGLVHVDTGQHDRELLTAVAAGEIVGSQRAAQRLREDPERPVTGLVPVRVVQCLEVVEIGHHERVLGALGPQMADPVLEAAPVDEPREPVGRRLQLGLRHDPEHPHAVARLVGERLERGDRVVVERLVDLTGRMHDADACVP